MYRILTILSFLGITLTGSGQSERKITIIHTNDLHSHLEGFAPESSYSPLTINDDKTLGGFSRIASVIKTEKEKNSGITLVVDDGDFLMGTLFQSLEVTTGFQLRLMKMMGYDVACLGNHEFDYGPGKLASVINSALAKGEIPPLLLSNAVFSAKDSADDDLEALFNRNVIGRKYIISRDGLKFGFFSLMGKVADDNAALAPPVTFSRQIPLARKMVKELRNEKCDVIICLSHSGIEDDHKGGWEGEDVDLAEKVKGIDIIISGHTHTRLSTPIIVNGIPIVQTGEYGQNIGELSFTYSEGNLTIDNYSLIPVDDRIEGDPLIQELIDSQKKKINDEILRPIGLDYFSPVVESDFLLECNEMGDIAGSNLGPMVADAIYNYMNNNCEGGTDISMVAVGVIRDKIVPGKQTAADIFRIMSMGTGKDLIPGYPLSRIYVTGKELKSILEILQVAYKSTPANYCYYSGLRVDFNPDKGLLKKIIKVEIISPDGKNRSVDFSKKNNTLYSLTANSYMLEFIGIIKKMSYGLINVVPKDSKGIRLTDMAGAIADMDSKKDGLQEGKEWLALMDLIRFMDDSNGNGLPEIDMKYRMPVRTFFPVGNKPKE
jgi:5'-nucleotidase / UDP-sugar diphosphatase